MIYRKIVEVSSKERLKDLITDSGFNFTVLEDLQDGHSIVEIWCSDSTEIDTAHRKNLGDITSLMATAGVFVRYLPTHKASPAVIGQIRDKNNVVVEEG